jgi:DNA-binding response OmpR family regulator
MNYILVVDDDKDILTVLKVLLSMRGFNVIAISSGEAVPNHLTNPRPDVILLDIDLGTTDGRVICKDLKSNADTKDIPIVIFSANHKMMDSALASDADKFIEKPFEVEQLVATLKDLCN